MARGSGMPPDEPAAGTPAGSAQDLRRSHPSQQARQQVAREALRRAQARVGPPPTSAPPADRQREAGDSQPDPHAVARDIVLRQLALAPRTRAQLAATLRRRGCPDDVAERVLDRMAQVGLVDDAAYAQLLVQSRRRIKGLSGAALRRELRDKGVADEIAAQAVGPVDEAAERARAQRLVDRRLRTMGGLDPQVQARRLAAMLARKGYATGTAYTVVRDAIAAAPETPRD